ncbi:hypothetical protein [Parasutterella sp.]|uniref:hypothetical protein n=1 Tax=Parasutterella sp. TaxID=2049037 RepID=UPI003521F874
MFALGLCQSFKFILDSSGKKYEEALAMAADWLLSVATIAKEKQDELQSLLSPKTEKL